MYARKSAFNSMMRRGREAIEAVMRDSGSRCLPLTQSGHHDFGL